ncbi:hypothetical protein GGI43DRAFT_401624 [Trichoderma evansii]
MLQSLDVRRTARAPHLRMPTPCPAICFVYILCLYSKYRAPAPDLSTNPVAPGCCISSSSFFPSSFSSPTAPPRSLPGSWDPGCDRHCREWSPRNDGANLAPCSFASLSSFPSTPRFRLSAATLLLHAGIAPSPSYRERAKWHWVHLHLSSGALLNINYEV